jgi:hypothetical protein
VVGTAALDLCTTKTVAESQQKDKRRVKTPIVSALRKKKERDNKGGGNGEAGSSWRDI